MSFAPVLRLVSLLAAMAIMAPGVVGHDRSQSSSLWEVDGNRLGFEFLVDLRRITQLAPLHPSARDLETLLHQHLEVTLKVRQDAIDCPLQGLQPAGSVRPVLQMTGSFLCPQALTVRAAQVGVTSFLAVSADHVHLVRVRKQGRVTASHVLREGASVFAVGGAEAHGGPSGDAGSPSAVVTGFLGLGFTHVLSGLDHMVFLLCLLMAAGRLSRMIWAVTGFTVGHSLSLGLAASAVLTPDSRLIEALIGFTVAVTALDVAGRLGVPRRRAFWAFAALIAVLALLPWQDAAGRMLAAFLIVYVVLQGTMRAAAPQTWMPVLSILFGLAHGAGFAGALSDLGFEEGQLLWSLLGFNIGVELAQLTALLIAALGYILMTRLFRLGRAVVEAPLAAACFGLGCFWTITRLAA